LANYLGVDQHNINAPQLSATGNTHCFRIYLLGRKIFSCLALACEERTLAYSGIVVDCVSANSQKSLVFAKYIPVWCSGINESHILHFIKNTLGFTEYQPSWLHGSLVQVRGKGVLILGYSGAGKTELLRNLLDAGHQFVSDDIVECDFSAPGVSIGQAPLTQFGRLESKHVGLIDVPLSYGLKRITYSTPINLVIVLGESFDIANVKRIVRETPVVRMESPTVRSVYQMLDSQTAMNLSMDNAA
jgi:serine kinase of HPr protein (carbohydrate metabolism regulator)